MSSCAAEKLAFERQELRRVPGESRWSCVEVIGTVTPSSFVATPGWSGPSFESRQLKGLCTVILKLFPHRSASPDRWLVRPLRPRPARCGGELRSPAGLAEARPTSRLLWAPPPHACLGAALLRSSTRVVLPGSSVRALADQALAEWSVLFQLKPFFPLQIVSCEAESRASFVVLRSPPELPSWSGGAWCLCLVLLLDVQRWSPVRGRRSLVRLVQARLLHWTSLGRLRVCSSTSQGLLA